jgi:exonuclease SbcC
MLITRIELENIKSYRRFTVDLRRGTTAVSGANGAGKTTLVEAIGYTLFDYLPYNQKQFVREGEKFGRIVVHLIGSDDRPYVVERRCGSGARWFIYDEEANDQVDQRADVVDRLHDLFGIERDRPLDSLFRDALGVPQGTFTAIFLESASKRKQTFDALLQIEDYKTAAEYLLDVQKTYKEQMQEQQNEINRLEYETRDLGTWEEQLLQLRQFDEQDAEQQSQWRRQLLQHKERFIALTEQQNQLRILQQSYESSQQAYQHHQTILSERVRSLQQAQEAQQIVAACLPDFQRCQQVSEVLKLLRKSEQQRNVLRQQQATVQKAEATAQATIKSWQGRLAEVDVARQRVAELAPFVEQQECLEQQRDNLRQQVALYKKLVEEGPRLQRQLALYRERQTTVQQRIASIEPLQAVAALFVERSDALTELRIKESERTTKEKVLRESRERLKLRLQEREQLTAKLRKAERNVQIIEEHRQEAEEMPTLQEQREQILARKSRLEGNIEGYARSRAQAAGGLCPLLREPCLNVRERGIMSLESYFDGLLKDGHDQLARVEQQHEAINERIRQIKKYADALSKLDQYVEQRDNFAEQLRNLVAEITQLEQEIAERTREIEALQHVGQQIKAAEAAYQESKRASDQVAELGGLYKQLQQGQEQIQQYEADLQACQCEMEGLRGSDAQLKLVEHDLATLRDPRTQRAAQQDIIAREGYFQQQLQAEQQRLQTIQQQLQQLQEQLAVYQTLDSDIAMQEAIRQQSESGYKQYLTHEKEAQALPEREQAHQQQLVKTQWAEQELHKAEEAYRQADAAFNRDELVAVDAEIRRLESELSALEEKRKNSQAKMAQLAQQIETAKALRLQLEAAQKEYQVLDDLHTMMAQFRVLLKEAAPHVLKAMLNDISAEANRIFSEIMGDRSVQLSWQDDYEIMLRRQGVNRSFAQLSGGEQMSAALAIRLALLKKLSNLNIAFFDEPTQNMDELRRMNLAEQIRRVRGFEQLIVISHDDTFEQGLDSIVRLNKVNGETHLLSEEEIRMREVSFQELNVG